MDIGRTVMPNTHPRTRLDAGTYVPHSAMQRHSVAFTCSSHADTARWAWGWALPSQQRWCTPTAPWWWCRATLRLGSVVRHALAARAACGVHHAPRAARLAGREGTDTRRGDAGMELEVISRYKLNVKIIIVNNNGIYQGLDELPEDAALQAPPTSLMPYARYEKVRALARARAPWAHASPEPSLQRRLAVWGCWRARPWSWTRRWARPWPAPCVRRRVAFARLPLMRRALPGRAGARDCERVCGSHGAAQTAAV